MKEILAAVDFSRASDAVVAQCEKLARASGARVHVIHVAPPDPELVGWDAGPLSVRKDVAKDLREEHLRVQAVADRLRAAGVETKALLVQGPIVEKVLEVADRISADVVVVGTHGHGALYRLLLGSVAEALVRASTRPLLVVPARPG